VELGLARPHPDGGLLVDRFGPFILHRRRDLAELFFQGQRVRSISIEQGVRLYGEDQPIDLSNLLPWSPAAKMQLAEQCGILEWLERARTELKPPVNAGVKG
jgi:hypothetical protein